MTKINISPAWKDVKPKGFYVYLHRRASDRSVFYVGKGINRRAYSSGGRSLRWRNEASLHGVIVEICQDGINEEKALLLERWLICKFHKENINIVNISLSGKGASGFRFSKEKRLELSRIQGGRTVYCSNGMTFDYVELASEWIREHLSEKASATQIINCCNGRSESAYGFNWSYICTPKPPKFTGQGLAREKTRRSVYCSNGMFFESIVEARDWLIKNVSKGAATTNISRCCKGQSSSYIGFAWSYVSVPKQPIKTGYDYVAANNMKKVKCSNGMIFDSLKHAEEWLRKNGRPKARQSNISSCCSGRIPQAYGYKWRLST